ncbi:MAG: aldehyde dehydrogenase family protein, partial [Thermomicrobia bacterium]|nr:aldehyde dehydrogenase family protein [Thermomicrobia bacterium]
MIHNLIGGTWTEAAGETLPIFNPATGEEIERVPLSGASEVDRAVQAAARAYE